MDAFNLAGTFVAMLLGLGAIASAAAVCARSWRRLMTGRGTPN